MAPERTFNFVTPSLNAVTYEFYLSPLYPANPPFVPVNSAGLSGSYNLSKIPAAPIPPPMHIVTMP